MRFSCKRTLAMTRPSRCTAKWAFGRMYCTLTLQPYRRHLTVHEIRNHDCDGSADLPCPLLSLIPMASIRITSVPPGEAPAEIRQAWVGLTLPLLHDRPRHFLVSGVLSGPRGRKMAIFLHLITFRLKVQTGYVVPSLAAIEILERSDPVAGHWWRENAAHALRPRSRFVFTTDCCVPG